MLPLRNREPGGLVTDPVVFLRQLRDFVRDRGLAGCGRDWREVVRTFADERNFLDFDARRSRGGPRVLIEFGVQDGGERRVNGFFDALWDVVDGDFRRIESMVLNGEMTDIDGFAVKLMPYLSLAPCGDEVVRLDEAA
jgi:hypothetical protein